MFNKRSREEVGIINTVAFTTHYSAASIQPKATARWLRDFFSSIAWRLLPGRKRLNAEH
jgi:hypothetical protein